MDATPPASAEWSVTISDGCERRLGTPAPSGTLRLIANVPQVNMIRRTFLYSIGFSSFLGLVRTTSAQEPPSPERPEKEFTPLFNGKDLTGWRLSHPGATNWVVREAALVNERAGADIMTEERFWNFELRYEYMIPKNSNSGVYLRGRYEVQIDDNFGKQPSLNGDGAIYGEIAPRENATFPPGKWNDMRITLIGRTVTIVQNGKRTIDKKDIARPTPGALDKNIDEPGPIYLQGDHGTVTFRNIRIRRIPSR
jgi:hypothetical protein